MSVAAIRLEFLRRLVHDSGPVQLRAHHDGAFSIVADRPVNNDTSLRWEAASFDEAIDLAREDAHLVLRVPHGMAPAGGA